MCQNHCINYNRQRLSFLVYRPKKKKKKKKKRIQQEVYWPETKRIRKEGRETQTLVCPHPLYTFLLSPSLPAPLSTVFGDVGGEAR
jgi:hypothetical protein